MYTSPGARSVTVLISFVIFGALAAAFEYLSWNINLQNCSCTVLSLFSPLSEMSSDEEKPSLWKLLSTLKAMTQNIYKVHVKEKDCWTVCMKTVQEVFTA